MPQSNVIRVMTIHFPPSYKKKICSPLQRVSISHPYPLKKRYTQITKYFTLKFLPWQSAPESLFILWRFKTTEQNKRMIYNINTYTYIKIHKQLPAPPLFRGRVCQKLFSIKNKENHSGFKLVRPCFKPVHPSITSYKRRWLVKHSV